MAKSIGKRGSLGNCHLTMSMSMPLSERLICGGVRNAAPNKLTPWEMFAH